MQNQRLIFIGVFVHLVFFYSIFDIYFTTPLVHGMTPHKSPHQAPARRLVLFVADGLRADKFYELDENGKSRAPYLRSVIEERGAWGVSHTRVPTESRPGHVALIAGFYEDVSAVAKGWKENPVEFDSVFNESRYTWSWGSPDILPMFAKGATGDHVVTHQYPAELEDFASSDMSKLDTWVFSKFKEFLSEAKTNPHLHGQLHQHSVVFFLHLLGIDTNGHSHKPHSQEYLNNIKLLDSGIQEVVNQIQEFYGNDGKTAFIMSSDHGMTNWGSHGAGHATETLTPVVAWGAGVRPPVLKKEASQERGYFEGWQLNHLQRSDVEQADIAPLMAALIGVPFPVNSVGRIPLDYLSCNDPEKAELIFANAQQVLAQFQVKMEEKKRTTLSLAFRPFRELTVPVQMERTRTIRNLIKTANYKQAIEECQDLISLALKGLNYYQKYDRFFLGISVTCGFIGWSLYVLIIVLREFSGVDCVKTKLDMLDRPLFLQENVIKICFGCLTAIILVLLAAQSLPWTYYLYCLIPVGLWLQVSLNVHVLQETVQQLWKSHSVTSFTSAILACCVGLEILVMGFFRRELLSIGLICMSAWPLRYWNKVNDRMSVVGWSVCCLALAIFPMMPVVGRATNYNLVLTAGIVSLVLSLICIQKLKLMDISTSLHKYSLNYVQMLLIAVSIIIVMSTSSSISDKQGLPLINQLISWLILVVSFTTPMLAGTGVLQRLLTIAQGFLCPYLLLSISHEAVFVVCLCVLMYFWLRVEATMTSKNKRLINAIDFVVIEVRSLQRQQRCLEIADVRRGFFFIFFILTGFFGTGNIASINSFEPASVYCFLTVFSPFVMGSLMMIKNVIPMVLVTCAFRAIHIATDIPIRALFLVVLIMSDFMALNFFFLVRDYGSWLEIGTSISHYVIVMCMVNFLMLLFGLSHVLTTYTTLRYKSHLR